MSPSQLTNLDSLTEDRVLPPVSQMPLQPETEPLQIEGAQVESMLLEQSM